MKKETDVRPIHWVWWAILLCLIIILSNCALKLSIFQALAMDTVFAFTIGMLHFGCIDTSREEYGNLTSLVNALFVMNMLVLSAIVIIELGLTYLLGDADEMHHSTIRVCVFVYTWGTLLPACFIYHKLSWIIYVVGALGIGMSLNYLPPHFPIHIISIEMIMYVGIGLLSLIYSYLALRILAKHRCR